MQSITYLLRSCIHGTIHAQKNRSSLKKSWPLKSGESFWAPKKPTHPCLVIQVHSPYSLPTPWKGPTVQSLQILRVNVVEMWPWTVNPKALKTLKNPKPQTPLWWNKTPNRGLSGVYFVISRAEGSLTQNNDLARTDMTFGAVGAWKGR